MSSVMRCKRGTEACALISKKHYLNLKVLNGGVRLKP
jgi:hypothetical protein